MMIRSAIIALVLGGCGSACGPIYDVGEPQFPTEPSVAVGEPPVPTYAPGAGYVEPTPTTFYDDGTYVPSDNCAPRGDVQEYLDAGRVDFQRLGDNLGTWTLDNGVPLGYSQQEDSFIYWTADQAVRCAPYQTVVSP